MNWLKETDNRWHLNCVVVAKNKGRAFEHQFVASIIKRSDTVFELVLPDPDTIIKGDIQKLNNILREIELSIFES